jgi:hypothetical protein
LLDGLAAETLLAGGGSRHRWDSRGRITASLPNKYAAEKFNKF